MRNSQSDEPLEEPLYETGQRTWWQRWLGRNEGGSRLAIAVLFVLLLALFLHFREVRIELPELNKVSSHYTIGQIDFAFPDEEATLILKEQSLRDISAIYKLEEGEVHERRIKFENMLIHDQKWRHEYPEVTFEEAYKAADALEDMLLQVHFSDPRTLQKMRELGVSTAFTSPLHSPENQAAHHLPKDFWGRLEKMVFVEANYHSETSALVLNFFENQKWALEKDADTERDLRQAALDHVPKVYTQVFAGAKIISPGEKITARHIAMLKAMKHALMEKRKILEPLTVLGSLLLASIFTMLGAVYLRIQHLQIFRSLQKVLILFTIIILTFAIAKTTEYFLINKADHLVDVVRYPLFVPFASFLVCILVGTEVALFVSGFLAVILGITLAVDPTRFLVINLVASAVAIISARRLHRRNEVFAVYAKVWFSCIPVIIAFNLISNNFWDLNLIADMASSVVFMSVTALLVVSLLPLLESFFHVMTDMALMEYSDPNSELLRRLSLEAPGTYQHSLVVGNLAETAARAIGANGLFCRVATLYHDVGKLFNPHYFTENQFGGFNIHQLLTPQESAQVIVSHVHEGETLARKYRLPQRFIDIIREHHGTTLVYYFFCKQVEQMEGDVSKVDEKLFGYPGPKPRTKESAIIMICDCVEAASRSLDDACESMVSDLVERIIAEKIEEGQFDECALTFEDLSIVKKSIIKNLVVTRHVRVKYPQKKAEEPARIPTTT